MRQAGLKPKNHSSGVYWVRAASGNGNGEDKQPREEGFGILGLLFLIAFGPIVLIISLIERLFNADH
jgi:hypothetical protein